MLYRAALTLLFASASVFAADLVFVFDGESTRASVFDAETLLTLGRPEVGSGATAAFRAWRPGGSRYYVVGGEGVAILDERLERVGSIPLTGPFAGPLTAAFSQADERLVVGAGGKLYLIDTERDEVATVIEPKFRPTSIAVRPGSGQALLLGEDARSIWELDLALGELTGPTSALPAVADALAVSVGGARVTAAAGRGLFELASGVLGGQGGNSTAVPAGGAMLAVDDAGNALWTVDGELRRVVAGQAQASTLTDPATGEPLGDGVVDVGLASGGAAFVLMADSRLLRFGEVGGEQTLLSSGDALAITTGPTNQGFLTIIAGNFELVQSGGAFQITVGGPPGGVPLTASAVPDLITCDMDGVLLTQSTTIDCTAGSVQQQTAVTLTVTAAGLGQVTFTITVVPVGVDGLNAITPTNVTVLPGENANLIVELVEGGLPKAGVDLVISEGSSDLSCPTQITTAQNGRASFNCSASGAVTTTTDVVVTVSDGTNTVQFTVTIAPPGQQVDTLEKTSNDPVNVFGGATFNLGVRTLTGGQVRAGITVAISEASSAISCPASAVTGVDGRVTVQCTAGSVASNQSAVVTISEGGRLVTFTINVLGGAQANGLSIISGDNQTVGANSGFPQPLVVAATVTGQAQPNIVLTVTPESGVVFCINQILTDLQGIGTITCSAGSVQAITTVAIQVSDDFGRSLLDAFQITVVPGSVGVADQLLLLSNDTITAQAGGIAPGAIRVRALNGGQPAASVTIFPSSAVPGVTFTPPVATTNVNGEATISANVPCTPASGELRVGLTQGAADVTVDYTTVAGPLSQIRKLNGDNQSGSAGATFPLALLVKTADVCGGAIGSRPLSWEVIPADAATLIGAFQTTNGAGEGSTRVRAGARGGPFTVRASSGVFTADFMLTVTNTPTTLQAVSGGGVSIPAGETSNDPVVVRVLNDQGQPVANIDVAFRVASGDAVINPTSAVTDASGRAQTTVTAGQSIGQVVVEAAAIGRTVTFTVFVVGQSPVVTVEGFTSGASFRPGFSPGATGSIFGVGIVGEVEGVVVAPFPFPTELRGVQVLINNTPAPIFALIKKADGSEQINIQVPFGINASSTATVTIINNGSQTSISGIPIFATQPGVFEVFVDGGLFAAALDANFALIRPANPVPAGGVVQLFLTGLGRTTPAVATNQVGPSPPATVNANVVVGLNDAGIPILGAFYAPGLISVYQVNFIVPANLPPGNYRLTVVVDGIGSQVVTLVVGR